MANGIVEKRIDKLRAEYLKNRHDDGWHAHQDCHGKAALRGVNPHLALDLETFTDHIGQVIQNLGEVAAGFALQHHGGDEELHVHQPNPLGEIHNPVPHPPAPSSLLQTIPEPPPPTLPPAPPNHFPTT